MVRKNVKLFLIFFIHLIFITDTFPKNIKSIPNKGKKSVKASSKSLGANIKGFSEGVASQVDKVIQKKMFELWDESWTLQGIPILFPFSNEGFHVGFRVNIQNIERQDPHKYQIEAQILASDLGRYKHLFKLDYPRIFNDSYSFVFKAAYDRDIHIPYFGVGNFVSIDYADLMNNPSRYHYVLDVPNFYIEFLRRFGDHLKVGPFIGIRWVGIVPQALSILENSKPFGIDGGATHSLGITIQWEEVDFNPYPTRGFWHELFLTSYNKLIGSKYSFLRVTYNYRHYWLLRKKMTLAHRSLLEWLGSGNVPFYELGIVGGPDVHFLGGTRYFRGYEPNSFIDTLRAVFGFELRWDPFDFEFNNQNFTFGFVPFIDIGRVWHGFQFSEIGGFHASAGFGARLSWNKRFVIRSDVAITRYRVVWFAELGHSF